MHGRKTMGILAGAAALLASPALGQQAQAPAQNTLPTIQATGNAVAVHYSWLETANAEGMQAFMARVSTAATTVCRYDDGQLRDGRTDADCRQGAKVDAMSQYRRNESARLNAAIPAEQAAVNVRAATAY